MKLINILINGTGALMVNTGSGPHSLGKSCEQTQVRTQPRLPKGFAVQVT